MRQSWTKQELVEYWSLLPDERRLFYDKMGKHQLAFASMLKIFQYTGRFPENMKEFPKVVLEYLANNLKLNLAAFYNYDLNDRTAREHKSIIRSFLNFKIANASDIEQFEEWLVGNVLPKESVNSVIEAKLYERYRDLKIVPPSKSQIEQFINKALLIFEQNLFAKTAEQLSELTKQRIDELINTSGKDYNKSDPKYTKVSLNYLKHDPRQLSVETVLNEIAKLRRIQCLELPKDLSQNISPKVLQKYRLRILMEKPSQINAHPVNSKYAMIAAFCHLHEQAIMDSLTDLLIQVTNKIATRAEKRVIKELLQDLRKVTGKTGILYRIAMAAIEYPKGIVNEVIYPVAGEQTLRDIVREFKNTGAAYQSEIHTTMRSSYGTHYRRILTTILSAIKFHTNNEKQNSIIKALNLLEKYFDSKSIYYSIDEIVVEENGFGEKKINRINYEMEVLQALRDKMRCKEVWIENACRYRNPDEDLPKDFLEKKDEYFQLLKQPIDMNKRLPLQIREKNNV